MHQYTCDFAEQECEYGIDTYGFCGSHGGSAASDFIAFEGWVYFVASDGSYGRELWRTNGDAVERLTDINPEGDSFVEDRSEKTNKALQITLHEGELYLRAQDASGTYGVYRYKPGNKPELVSDPAHNVGFGTFASVGSTLYWSATDPDGQADIFAYTPGAAPFPIGAIYKYLAHLRGTPQGLIFRGYDSSYRTLVYTEGAIHQTSVPSLREGGIRFRDEICGDTSNRLTCLDGTPPPDGVREIEPEALNSSSHMTVVGDALLCFRGNVSGYRLFCTDGIDPLFALPGKPDGFHLADHHGVLYFTSLATDTLYRWEIGSDQISEVDITGGAPLYTTSLRGTPFLLYNAPEPGGTDRTLRIYNAESNSARQVPSAGEPYRFFVWHP